MALIGIDIGSLLTKSGQSGTRDTGMAERGRQPGFRMSNEHRDKIKNSNILNALIQHACGERDMSATQVSAGLGLLKKVMPDLAATQISGDDENPLNVIHKIARVITNPGNTNSKGI